MLVFPGALLGLFHIENRSIDVVWPVVLGLTITSLIASANYTINEWLDADTDRFHPEKAVRPAVQGFLNDGLVLLQYACLLTIALILGWRFMGNWFLVVSVCFVVSGLVYNVKPLRTKDVVIVDILSESMNSPIRLLLGWFCLVDQALPPLSLILAYWMAGAFLMSIKRYSELGFIGDREMAGKYRLTFRYYTQEGLLLVAVFFGLVSYGLLAVFLVQLKAEYSVVLPLVAMLFVWCLRIGLKKGSGAPWSGALYREARLAPAEKCAC